MRKFRIYYKTNSGLKRQRTIKISNDVCYLMDLNEINMSDKVLNHACYTLFVISKTDYYNCDYVTEIIKDNVTFSKD